MKRQRPGAREAGDAALMRDVRAMLQNADPVPQQVQDASRALLTWRTVDAALAELLRSGATPVPPAGH
jgi:hypothetical protein